MNINLTPPPPRLLDNTSTPDLRSVSSQSLNLLRLIAITLPMMLLLACGGGGGGGTAAPTTMMPGMDDMMTPPPNPLADLDNFEPSTGHASIQAIQDIISPVDIVVNIGNIVEAGNLNFVAPTCAPVACSATLPGAANTVVFRKDNLKDISLINDNAFFSPSSYSSEITNGVTIEDIEGITFARGKLTGTRAVDSETLEFESFAGWLDGNIFGVTQITIGASGSEQYRFISYGAGSYDADTAINPTATGTETTSATWEGATVATIKASRDFIFGDATITVNFTDTNVDLEFDNWHDLDNQELSTMEPIIYEGAGLGQGRFSLRRNNITEAFGRFYGTGHTGVGGWFNTMDVTGAFGATRQQ